MGRNECRLDDRPVRARGSLDTDPLGSSPTGHGCLFEGGGGVGGVGSKPDTWWTTSGTPGVAGADVLLGRYPLAARVAYS